MRWILVAAAAAIAAGLWLPGEAAQPGDAAVPAVGTAAAASADAAITFEQYRDWRINFIERRRAELAIQLEDAGLPAAQKDRLTRVKAYYDGFAALPEAERDSRFRRRFELIDKNHDGSIDAAERAAWRDKRRAFYRPVRPPQLSTEAGRHNGQPSQPQADAAETAD